MAEQSKMDKLISLCKRRGFIFPSSEIYGGFSASYDYGPLGVEFKNNIKKSWWKALVQKRNDVIGLDSSILTPRIVWEASGHIASFHDPLVECKTCHHRFRADHLLEERQAEPGYVKEEPLDIKNINCPDCGGELTAPKNFNLLMKTELGAVEDEKSEAYLRGETCQGIYLDYLSVKDSMRKKLPFGIAQIGKAFRNEITVKNFIFRMREFEQMEMQYFVNPKEVDKIYQEWRMWSMDWYKRLVNNQENLRWRQHEENERAHYAKDAWDIEYNTPMGWKEFAGVHNRGSWDLSRHGEYSKMDMNYKDQETGEEFIPWIAEVSMGCDRAALLFLLDAFEEVETRSGESEGKHETEVVLRLHKTLAPIKVAILPLSKKEPLIELSRKIQADLWGEFMTQYDETGSIGKRYRRQDEIGTPYCLTVDFETPEDNKVTVRDRDTMEQERIAVSELREYFRNKLLN
ncbi:MAG: Glycine-tRNA ligase [Candidatus Magasanikbacteria bacterium GW2011_GWC2_40_17]|uniref:Glycine--tRNA ligase n=1 Tax=Candidatus Magasanikbacteria bacterium GW2011_GWA2_42_32 TaxID=1619039 RepID=A0A0G1D4J5_9BACT|nr:MAG: Glycine-tRNA ligase [Candidatus Magasanikbacteria bacterium GW2011_GWC2_40_17]KKS56958.1 MAG: Glycine-tRNA ligase [Candidatus Magasanikbacteria bacterium GW2011_GWA2_42_32]